MASWRLTFDCDPGPSGKPEQVVVVKPEGEPCVIGRGQHADVRCYTGAISREQCTVTVTGQGVFLVDLPSSGGTWFNGERIGLRKQLLKLGDTFLPGQAKVTLVSVDPA